MADIVKKPVEITETILRDAHQSLIATRMTTEQMLRSLIKWDKGWVSFRRVLGWSYIRCISSFLKRRSMGKTS